MKKLQENTIARAVVLYFAATTTNVGLKLLAATVIPIIAPNDDQQGRPRLK